MTTQQTIGVIGAGTMGNGIAQVCALAGLSVVMLDVHETRAVSAPGQPRRHYQIMKSAAGERRLDPDRWLATAPDNQGSWWPAWHEWLRAHSGDPVKPPRMGLPGARALNDAPGRYVLEK